METLIAQLNDLPDSKPEIAQEYSCFMRVNEWEQVYIVSRYFYTTMSELAEAGSE